MKKPAVEINNLTKYCQFDVFIKKAALSCLKRLILKKNVSVVLVGEAKIKELNQHYRRKNKVTDVLAFGDFDRNGFFAAQEFLGEIVICLPQAKRQAREHKVSFKEEVARLLIHGLLHLKGYDHEKSKSEAKKMFSLQERILKHVTYNM